MRTFRFLFIVVTIAMLAVTSLIARAQQPAGPAPVGLFPDSPKYALHGPHWVGTREFVIPDKDGKRPLPLTVWYPTSNSDMAPEEITYTYTSLLSRPSEVKGHAIADAWPDRSGGPLPLVIFVHPDWITRFAAVYLTEHLASQGFVVMAAQRVGMATGDTIFMTPPEMESVGNSFVYGPTDVQREIDFAATLNAPSGALPRMIDVEHIAVIGQYDGADMALAAAGARYGFGPVRKWCDSVAKDPNVTSGFGYYTYCSSLVSAEERLLAMRKVTAKPGEVWPAFDVKGIDAVVSMNAWGNFYEAGDLSGIKMPAMVIYGNLDPDTTRLNGLIYDGLTASPAKAQVVFEHGVGAFSNEACDSLQIRDEYFICYQEQVWGLERGHDRVRYVTTAFLLDVLKGDKEAHKALLPDAVKLPGIQYKTTMK